ncbi:MAG TPA: ArsA-related P-loop ATPase [Acidimicrobiia bacterium]|nr:ArsA-related P-loop ATPase [Acidimicrobiia bacterium]
MTRLIVVSGKGGVGKSAVAAATALAAHRDGARVLALSMVGTGSGLASHTGAGALPFEPVELFPGLHALAVDRSKALVEYLRVQIGLPPFAALPPVIRAFDALAAAAPAVREIVTVGKVLWEVKRGTWDVVVADGPPTGQIGSFLRAPTSISELVSGGRIAEQAAWMIDTLRSDDTLLRIVTLPEELPMSETRESLQWLAANPVVSRVDVIANRVLPKLELVRIPGGRVGEAARLHLELQNEQDIWLGELPVDHQLPFLFGIASSEAIASHLADEIEQW